MKLTFLRVRASVRRFVRLGDVLACRCNMHKTRHLFLALVGIGLTLATVPAWAGPAGDLTTLAAAPETMKPGQYVWNDATANSEEPLAVSIDLSSQLAWVYRGDTLIGLSTISSGASG